MPESRPLVGALAVAGLAVVIGVFMLGTRGPAWQPPSYHDPEVRRAKRKRWGLEGARRRLRRALGAPGEDLPPGDTPPARGGKRGVDLIDIWGRSDEAEAARGRAFRWLARVGAAPRFGSRPIGWYQEQMTAAIDVLKERAYLQVRAPRYFKVQNGTFYARSDTGRWKNIRISPASVYDLADRKLRGGRTTAF